MVKVLLRGMNLRARLQQIKDREARWLLQDKYGGKKTPEYVCDVKRLHKEEPVDYIIGHAPFLDVQIDLSCHPLIPRVETEHWAGIAIEEIKKARNRNVRVLDMFAGSGCIGLAILKHSSLARVDFAEIDSASLKQIAINAKKNKISMRRFQIIKSDCFENIRKQYDYILANPPYIPLVRKNKLSRSVTAYEPHVALFGGGDGLLFIKKFLFGVRWHLKKEGIFYMEFDSPQKQKIEKLVRAGRWREIEFLKDQYGRWRVLRGKK